jgi:hypothetical protein
VMVNNSTIINKTNNHLNSPNIKIRRLYMTLEIQVLSCNRNTNVAVLNRLMGWQLSPLALCRLFVKQKLFLPNYMDVIAYKPVHSTSEVCELFSAPKNILVLNKN